MTQAANDMPAVFTIGHSNHSPQRFAGLLLDSGITLLCDVRSHPYSRFSPQFNREELQQFLSTHGIGYLYLGRELGGRPDDTACYVDGQVQYEIVAQTRLFQAGVDQILQELRRPSSLALMCAEKEPLECHRTLLVARHLVEAGVPVTHIHADGRLESHEDAIVRLHHLVSVPEADLFHTPVELRAEAYRRQQERIAWEAARLSAKAFKSRAAG